MIIGGLQKLTLIDYPDKLAATVFLAGCNFRCPFCYSSELVLPEKIKDQPKISEEEFFDFLETRQSLLEGIVICGGEPLINKDLPGFIKKIKKMEYAVKLDTNGSNPRMLKELIDNKLIDYVAMDVKAPKDKYDDLAGKKVNIKDVERSISLLQGESQRGNVDYEFRTTIAPGLLKKEDIIKIASWLSGSKRYYLQNFRPDKTLEPKYEKIKPYPDKYLLEIVKAVSPFFEDCRLRG